MIKIKQGIYSLIQPPFKEKASCEAYGAMEKNGMSIRTQKVKPDIAKIYYFRKLSNIFQNTNSKTWLIDWLQRRHGVHEINSGQFLYDSNAISKEIAKIIKKLTTRTEN